MYQCVFNFILSFLETVKCAELLFGTFFVVMNGGRATPELQAEMNLSCPLILSDLNQNGNCWTAFGTVVQYESSLIDFLIARLEVLPAVLKRFSSSQMCRHADSV
jgi:hypothetical protein